VEIREIESGRVVKAMSPLAAGWVKAIAVLPDGNTIVSTASTETESTIQLWDVASGNLIRTFNEPTKWGFLRTVAVTPDGDTFVVGCDDGTISVFRCKASGERPSRLCQRVAVSHRMRGGTDSARFLPALADPSAW
jgi:WD40 repeat protein